MVQIIYFDIEKIVSDCIQRIDRISFFARYLDASKCKIDEFESDIYHESISGYPIVFTSSVSESELDLIRKDLIPWSFRKCYNDIISSFVIFLDEILHMERILVVLESKFDSINKTKNHKSIDGFIKEEFEKIRKETSLYKKLEELSQYINQDDRVIFSKLYQTRNAIEHWDAHANPVSFKSPGDEYEISLPHFEIYIGNLSIDDWQKLEPYMKKNPSIKNKPNITVDFHKIKIKDGDKIIITKNDLMIFIQWIINVIKDIRLEILKKRKQFKFDI
ncbi:hypothetical protein [Candidatus Berkiella aquae]|uniref:Uncharacterized protein n=1 Tax=Candidatus Berkiella aquae TaxID=295108 RepID=A0A0Q9Z1J1_9GAMM|nr:hypothetical protein [Candidatus Berkiella aquae]MCS5712375.1 hypothetical protein [Candidatus Berkiella aquae]